MVEAKVAIIFGAVSVILIGSIVYLNIAEKKLKAKLHQKKTQGAMILELRSSIRKIKKGLKKPSENLRDLDEMARKVFALKFDLTSHQSYSNIAQKFAGKNEQASFFAEKMNEAFYSGEQITNRDIARLANYLENILIT